MNLTVTARIIGGAILTVTLLGILVFNGLSGVSSINDGLLRVTEESTPMLQQTSNLMTSLLKSKAQANNYHQSVDASELPSFESRFNQNQKDNNKAYKSLTQYSSDYEDINSALNNSRKKVKNYFTLIPQSFKSHQDDLGLQDQLTKKQVVFEDTADELGSLLSDFSKEALNKSVTDNLSAMSSMVTEATVTITDVLAIADISQVNVARNEITTLMKDFSKRFNQVTSDRTAKNNEYFNDAQSSVEGFKSLVVGSASILQLLDNQLNTKQRAVSELVESALIAEQALADLGVVSDRVNALNLSIKEDASEAVSAGRTVMIGLAIIALLAAVGINAWVLTSIRAPLAEVLNVMNKVADGDLRDKVDVHSEDEIGMLSEGINRLSTQLSGIMTEISNSSQQLSAAAEETSAISLQSNARIGQQKEQTDMIATAMTEMTATVDEVASSASNTLSEVQDANKEASSGQQIVQNNINTINGLASEIQRAAGVIDKLNEYSTNIGSVLDVIRGIADQTNLLALNAAIEAARAGEQGRGFAVVADEVRTLASKTQESTSEIQEMIERLQSGTQEAVEVMKSSTKEAQNSVTEAAKAGESLSKITRAVNIINDMSSHIASAADEQSTVSREMHENVLSISQAADQTAQGATENLAASQDMAKLAVNLQGLVGHFKF
jgi:methyl-accepting chemotaxis protein